MQDRYAGDIGDFQKLGLLRSLVGPPADGLRLGVVWYLTPDEDHNADGKHVRYLDPSHTEGQRYRTLDPELYDALASIVRSGVRSVAAIERSGVLPEGTVTFNQPLSFRDLTSSNRSGRIDHRKYWLAGALRATEAADLVFVDPDNGIRRADHPTGPHRSKAEKYCYLDELAAFAERRQSVVAYHHADRTAPVADQIARRLDEMADALPFPPIAAVRASKGTTRLFLVAAAPQHKELLAARLDALAAGPWSGVLAVTPFGGITTKAVPPSQDSNSASDRAVITSTLLDQKPPSPTPERRTRWRRLLRRRRPPSTA